MRHLEVIPVHEVVVNTAGWVRTESETETVEVRLSYDAADPLAVTVDVIADSHRMTWVFSRDLLADGLRSMVPLGEGQVQVQATSVLTEISGEDDEGRRVVLRLPWWNTREFVRLSQLEVPRGQESCDVDAWVAALTAPQD
jgi:hypothetical protein